MKNNKSKGTVITGVIAALAASSCCIPPVIAAIAGIGGASASLSWMEPLRPYLIGLAVIAISYAWYNHFKSKPVDNCGCNIEKPKWYQTKTFLIGMTLFAFITISLPYYSHLFFESKIENNQQLVFKNIKSITINIEGMTCDACQNHVNFEINKLNGIKSVKTSYLNSNSIIVFDSLLTNPTQLNSAIEKTGYKIIKNGK